MRVADGDRPMAGHGLPCTRCGVEPRQQRSTRGDDIGEAIERPFEGATHLHPARVVESQGSHHAVDDLEVVRERFGVGFDDDEFGAAEPVDRSLARGVERALR